MSFDDAVTGFIIEKRKIVDAALASMPFNDSLLSHYLRGYREFIGAATATLDRGEMTEANCDSQLAVVKDWLSSTNPAVVSRAQGVYDFYLELRDFVVEKSKNQFLHVEIFEELEEVKRKAQDMIDTMHTVNERFERPTLSDDDLRVLVARIQGSMNNLQSAINLVN